MTFLYLVFSSRRVFGGKLRDSSRKNYTLEIYVNPLKF